VDTLMAAQPAELPRLSEVESASFDHLTDAAAYYRRAADAAERTFTALRDAARHPGGTEWVGQAQEANLAARERDLVIAFGAVRRWHDADAVCTLGFEQMTACKQSVLEAVAEVRAAGFKVADDYTVTDISTGGTPAQRQARRAQAQGHRDFIRHRVALMVAYDREIAAKMDAALEGLAGITFAEHEPSGGHHGHIQAVDQHTFKQDPPPPAPPGNPFAGWTEEQKLQAAEDIAYGHAWEEHGKDFPGMREDGIARWIYETMNDPTVLVGTSKETGSLALFRDERIVFVDPENPDYGSIYKPDRDPLLYFLDSTVRTPPTLVPPEPDPPLPGGPTNGPHTASIIGQPPELPRIGDHPLVPVPPTVLDHPPTAAPPTVFDHPPLPPWLQDPSPPGFHVSPNQPPPMFDWDRPDPSPPATHGPASEPPHSPVISLPPLKDAEKAGLGLLTTIGGLLVLLAHPDQEVTPTP
jgi:hypothetical protein